MKTKNTIIWILIFLFLGIITFGRLPDTIGPSGFYWQLTGDSTNKENIPNIEQPIPIYTKDMIKIKDVSPRREIYFVGEQATVDINLYNPYDLDYNLSVYWILDDSRYLGWNTQDKLNKTLSSWITLNKEGDWVVNVLVSWEYKNKTYDTDKNIEIGVLE